MIIQKIYDKYQIMPQLQLHMLKVSGVAHLICDSFNKPIDKDAIISACLLHDMGNMAKIKLDRFPDLIQGENSDYWEKVLEQFREKYGNDDYQATYKILADLNISKNLQKTIYSLEFAKAPKNAKSRNYTNKICLYSDARTCPHGVVSLEERLIEVKDRYMKNKKVSGETFNQISKGLDIIEGQIFNYCSLKPDDITEKKIKPLITNLRYFDIKTES